MPRAPVSPAPPIDQQIAAVDAASRVARSRDLAAACDTLREAKRLRESHERLLSLMTQVCDAAADNRKPSDALLDEIDAAIAAAKDV